jgi:Tol biopolymer transport system component/DNA-binding winged helix-turn-helix (wHTH) protein
LLAILIRERGTLVTREELRRELWPDGTFVDFEPSLNAAVKRAREALGDSATAPRFIETLPRRGYRFVATVQEIGRPAPEELAAVQLARSSRSLTHSNVASSSGEPVGLTSHDASPPRNRPRAFDRTRIALAVALGMMAVLFVFHRGQTPARARISIAHVERLTNEGTVGLAAVSLDGRDFAYVRRDGLRETLWMRNGNDRKPVRLFDSVDGTVRSLTFVPGGFLHYTVFRPDKTLIEPFRVPTSGGPPVAIAEPAGRIAFNGDGSLYAYVSNFSLALRESRIVVSDAASASPRVIAVRTPPESFLLTKPAWSPDGSRLAVFGVRESSPASPELVVVDAGSGRVVLAKPIALIGVDSALWLHSGEGLVIAGRQHRTAARRLWEVSLPSGDLRPLTSDLSDYSLAGLSQPGHGLVAVRSEIARSIWTADLDQAGPARQVALNSGDLGGLEGIAWASAARLVYTAAESGNVDLWSLDVRDGTRRQITSDPADDFHPAVSADGRTVLFASNREGVPGIWTASTDGTNQRRLTSGADSRPSVSPDGVVVFQRGAVDTTPFTLWRLPSDGSQPVHIAETHSMRPAVSPDGRWIAHYLMTAEAWMLGVTPITGGPPARTLPISRTHADRVVRWSPDGLALAFIDGEGGASNIWVQSLSGGRPRKLTNLSEGRMTTFDWSSDGRRLAWTRINELSDVVAVTLDGGGQHD